MAEADHFTPDKFKPQITADGSCTFFSPEFGQTFHSHFGARQEAERKFVEPTQLALQAQQPEVKILDVCYGLGYNTAAALATIWQVNPDCYVEWVGLELDPMVPLCAIGENLLDSWPADIVQLLTELATDHQLNHPKINAQLLIGDARQTIQQIVHRGFQADAIFLDPFSPPSCPQLWTVDFLRLVAQCLKSTGYLATYSCSAAVRTALIEVGLKIGSTPPVGRRSPGTIAWWTGESDSGFPRFDHSKTPVDIRLSQLEREHLQTRAAIPYRDPTLGDCSELILQRRQLEQQTSSLETTSQWKKRWFPSDS
jgi:tRNA U34 5-methylaminomethyl-2-thiouridine-forming methyltransferase MnmC